MEAQRLPKSEQLPLSAARVIFLLPRRSFEMQRLGEMEPAKFGKLLAALSKQTGATVHVDLHVESWSGPIFSNSGVHLRVRLALFRALPLVAKFSIASRKSKAVSSGEVTGSKSSEGWLKSAWSGVAVDFWKKFYAAGRYSAVLGAMLTPAEILAARNLGIPTFEIQHGLLVRENQLREYFPEVRPDYYCMWPIEPRGVAFPRDLQSLRIPFAWRSNYSSELVEKESVLIALGNNPRLTSQLEETLEIVSERGWVPVLRFHPKTPNKSANTLKKEVSDLHLKARFSLPSKSPLQDELVGAKAVVSWSSTVWLDALDQSVPAVILHSETFNVAKNFLGPQAVDRVFCSVEDALEFCAVGQKQPRLSSLFDDFDFSDLIESIIAHLHPGTNFP